MAADDLYDLERFVAAQRDVFARAMAEIRAGVKRSHWMWFVFPQIAGLGRSETARFYALGSLAEAQAYLRHPVLGPRYAESVAALAAVPTPDPVAVFGGIDAKKLRSSLTLFERAGAAGAGAALDCWFDGARDAATLALI